MKGLIFMVIVTLVVLASFARPEKEAAFLTDPVKKTELKPANSSLVVQDSSTKSNYLN